jgi:hypothetical protein
MLERKGAGSSLAMTAAFEPDRLPPDELVDVRLIVTFTNPGPEAVTLYAGAAMFSVQGGWGSPTWDLRTEAAPAQTLLELRTWYGPPGDPPTQDYYVRHRKWLAAGESHTAIERGCFIPARRLSAEHLSPQSLDPDQMDGFMAPPPGTSVLAFGIDRDWALTEMKKRADFLRPGLLLFLPPGDMPFRLRYRQRPWTGFEPETIIDTEARCLLRL